MIELTMGNFLEVQQCVDEVLKRFGPEVWYRGHASSGWLLRPRVHRSYSKFEENWLAQRFRMRAVSRIDRCPDQDDIHQWLALMQHHRLPTRLLDWSELFLVAAYFAIGSESLDGDAAIWALQPGGLSKVVSGKEKIYFLNSENVRPLVADAFAVWEDHKDILPCLGPEIDPRMMLQQAAFTIHGDRSPLETHPLASEFLMKLIIPEDKKEGLRRTLWRLGVRRTSFFSDLESLAAELEEQLKVT
jgi:hypothetical protein